jgi:hypothetical protein
MIEGFPDDAWKDVQNGTYPRAAVPLYRDDDRFLVSKDNDGALILQVDGLDIKELAGVKELTIFDGLTLKIEQSDEIRMVVRLEDNSLKDKFNIVVRDIAFKAESIESPALRKHVEQVLRSWSRFLKPVRDGLTKEEYNGFWGELSIVRDYLVDRYEPQEAISIWGGPDGSMQDIAVGKASIEVKTSFIGGKSEIFISNLDQLDSDAPHAFLVYVLAGINSAGGRSLEDLYEEVAKCLASDQIASSNFTRLCSDLYDRASEEQRSQLNVVNKVRVYEIKDNFPRLTRSVLSNDIISASYSIRADSILPYLCSGSLSEVLDNV